MLDIINGAALLGAGGGGSIKSGLILAEQIKALYQLEVKSFSLSRVM